FPDQESMIQIEKTQVWLKELIPHVLADIWVDAANSIGDAWDTPALRIMVNDFPKDMAIRSWFRILCEAAPDSKSVYINHNTSSPDIHMKWPIRMGFIPDNSAQGPASSAAERWPSSTNARLLPIGRDNDNADIL